MLNYLKKSVTFLCFLCIHMVYAQENDSIHFSLLEAVFDNDIQTAQSLLQNGADVNFKGLDNVAAMHYAVNQNNKDMVELLISHEADINITDFYNNTPLILAAILGLDTILNLLILHDANLNTTDIYSRNAVHHAVFSANIISLDMLLFYEADKDVKDESGFTPFLYAVSFGDIDMLKLLIEADVDIHTSDNDGNNAILIAIKNQQTQMLEYLLLHNLDVKTVNKRNINAFELAVLTKNYNIIEMLSNIENVQIKYRNKFLWKTALFHNDLDLKKLLKKLHISRPISPIYHGLKFDFSIIGNLHDLLWLYNIKLIEANYNMSFSLGYGTRFWRNSIMSRQSETLTYQLFEKRQMLYVEMKKQIPLYSNPVSYHSFNLSVGIYMPMMFVNYQGLKHKPKAELVVSPTAGFQYNMHSFSIYAMYSYMNYSQLNVNPHKCVLGTNFFLNKRKPDAL